MRMYIRNPQKVGWSDHMQIQLLLSMYVEYHGDSFIGKKKVIFHSYSFASLWKNSFAAFLMWQRFYRTASDRGKRKTTDLKADQMTVKRKDTGKPHQVPSLCLFFEPKVIIRDWNGTRCKRSHIGFQLSIKSIISQSPKRDNGSINILLRTQSSVG